MKTLYTENLSLKPLTVDHAAQYYHIASDPTLYTYIPRDPPKSLEVMADRYKQIYVGKSSDGKEIWLNWFIQLNSLDNLLIGKLEATILLDRTVSIAYELSPAFQGKGFATEACLAMINTLQNDYSVTTVQA